MFNGNPNRIIREYTDVAVRMLQLTFPYLKQTELEKAVEFSCIKRMKNGDMYLHNNYSDVTVDTTVLEMANYILDREPIITTSGVLFNKHANSVNPLYKLIEEFINTRVKYKKMMFKYPKGSEMFQKYNLLQLLAKLDANALYGAIGAYSSVFYNLYLAEGITAQAQSCTKAMILAFESFLANNVAFRSLNEIVTFIDNVLSERSERHYNDKEVLDEDITLAESFFKIMATCEFGYIPSNEDMIIVWDMMSRLGQEDLNRLYYKNNLYSFMDNASMTKAMEIMLCKLDRPFMDPNEPPAEIAAEIDAFWDILKEYVYYGYQYIDRMDRVEYMVRKVAIVGDTDSSIVSLDAWYRYNLEKTYNIPMKIKTNVYKPFFERQKDEFGDFIDNDKIKVVPFIKTEMRLDYDFYTDEIIEVEKAIRPFTIIPQDGLRYSIINILAYCMGKMIIDYMRRYSMNSQSFDPDFRGGKCLLIAKNEFLFRRLLAKHDAKKNYADIQELQEGKVIPKDKALTIMGMPMTKTSLPDSTREKLQEILYEDILNCDEIDQIQVVKDLAIFEKQIYQAIMRGSKEYFKPATVKSIDNYDDPMRIVGIKGTIVYNDLRDEGMEALDLHARNSVDIVKIKINPSNVEELRESHPDKYAKCIKLMQIKQFANGIDVMALPINESVPEWLLDYVDFNEIITFNLSTFPLDSIGISKLGRDNISFSNIMMI